MRTAAKLAFEFLRSEGLSLERIAGVAKSNTCAARLWARGMVIPSGAAMRMIIAARVFAALKCPKAADDDKPRAEIAAFARCWLASRARDTRGAMMRLMR